MKNKISNSEKDKNALAQDWSFIYTQKIPIHILYNQTPKGMYIWELSLNEKSSSFVRSCKEFKSLKDCEEHSLVYMEKLGYGEK